MSRSEPRQAPRRLLEQPVARLVAVAVVVVLEAVEVEHRDADGGASRGARASSRGSSSSQARRLISPVRSSVCAMFSSRSSRSARSIATAASAASSSHQPLRAAARRLDPARCQTDRDHADRVARRAGPVTTAPTRPDLLDDRGRTSGSLSARPRRRRRTARGSERARATRPARRELQRIPSDVDAHGGARPQAGRRDRARDIAAAPARRLASRPGRSPSAPAPRRCCGRARRSPRSRAPRSTACGAQLGLVPLAVGDLVQEGVDVQPSSSSIAEIVSSTGSGGRRDAGPRARCAGRAPAPREPVHGTSRSPEVGASSRRDDRLGDRRPIASSAASRRSPRPRGSSR